MFRPFGRSPASYLYKLPKLPAGLFSLLFIKKKFWRSEVLGSGYDGRH